MQNLKTAQELAEERAATLDPVAPPKQKTKAELAHDIAAGVQLTAEELASKTLRDRRAYELFPSGDMASIGIATQYFEAVARASIGPNVSQQERDWMEAVELLAQHQERVRRLEDASRENVVRHDRLTAAVANVAENIEFEKARIVRSEATALEWKSNYMAFVVGGRDPNASAGGFLDNIQSAQRVAAFTRDVVLPSLELKLEAATSELKAFFAEQSSSQVAAHN